MTKRRDIEKRLRNHARENGLDISFKEGGSHIKVMLGNKTTTIPRHREVNELTTKSIYKQLGVKP